jgi:hypothetical protein
MGGKVYFRKIAEVKKIVNPPRQDRISVSDDTLMIDK